MQIPSIPQISQDASLLVRTKNVPSLQVGEIVQAEVLTVTDTAVAIRMKNSILEARTDLPLKQGEVLSLLVEEAGQDMRLRLIQGNGEGPALIKNTILSALNALKDLKPAAEDMTVLSSLIESIPQSLKELLPGLSALEKMMVSVDGLSGSVLKAAVQDSGVLFEAKLRLLILGEGQEETALNQKVQTLANSDMKAALLSLRQELVNSSVANSLSQSGVRADALTAAVDTILKNIELLQLQSRLSDTLQVFVPFVWKDLKEGELIFRESGRDKPGKESYSCTVNLDLERAGRTSARLLLQSGKIYADVLTESKGFFQLLQDNAMLFRKQADAAGIKLAGFTIHRASNIEIKTPQGGGLNIRI
ncbi:MAG TPA: flagellar hook-length control protein FliK [Nitrospirota bacterium]|nr:flagellar hook-length control protein FliK [Nitrospirota bacterium]